MFFRHTNKVRKVFIIGLAGLMLFFYVPNISFAAEEGEFSESDLAVYANAAQEKCIHILTNDTFHGSVYDGVKIGGNYTDPNGGYVTSRVQNPHIGGDRLGYFTYVGMGTNVVIDGQDKGPGINFWINDNHTAFLSRTGERPRPNSPPEAPKVPIDNLFFDGQDLGEVSAASVIGLNGDNVLYTKWFVNEQKSHVFVNERDFGEGAAIDYDGVNTAIMKEKNDNLALYYNGNLVSSNLGIAGGFIGAFSVKDGHFAYAAGSVNTTRVRYDGADRGKGWIPLIEGNHLAYSRPQQSSAHSLMVYDGVEYGTFGSNVDTFSLAGDHFAFMRKDENGNTRANIDGVDFPGNFDTNAYIEISKRQNCSGQNAQSITSPSQKLLDIRNKRKEAILSLQTFLVEKGFLASNRKNGMFTLQTKKALKKFQKSVGLPPTGKFDKRTKDFIGDT